MNKFDKDKLLIKLTSRKFILAVVGVVIGVFLIATGNGSAEVISGVISTAIFIVMYLISETAVDINVAKSLKTTYVENIANGISTVIEEVKEIGKGDIDENQ